MTYTPERDDDPPRRHYIRCADAMCGAEDCPNCRPESFRGGVYVGDIEEALDDNTFESNGNSFGDV